MKRTSFSSPLITFAVVAIVVSVFMTHYGLFANFDDQFEDRLRSPHPISSEIVIIAIDNKTLEALGQWPLPRVYYAELLRQLDAVSPKAIGLDVIMPEPSRIGTEDDVALTVALTNIQTRVVLPVEGLALTRNGNTKADKILNTRTEFDGPNVERGHVNLLLDRDGVVRDVPLTITHKGSIYRNLSAVVVDEYDRTGVERIVYAGVPGTVARYSLIDVLENESLLETFRNKYVFIGSTASDLHDEQITPLSSSGSAMSGVEIQAQIANMLRTDLYLTPLPQRLLVGLVVLLSIIPFFIFYFTPRARLGLLFLVLLFVLNTWFVSHQFNQGTLISLWYTSLAIIIGSITAFGARYFILDKERRQVEHTFSKYVSPDVLSELMSDPSKGELGGVEANVTVFFSDIRGFTTLSEGLSPRALTSLLNKYLTIMTDIILDDRGVIDKYIGDAIMAFWGAPLVHGSHATHAVVSSLRMLKALDMFNEKRTARSERPIEIGIGLNTGDVIVGNMGSHQRFDYTVIGDAVNLAARLEGQTKTYGVRLLISEYTLESIPKEKREEHNLLIREIDKVTVKGKTQPVALYAVAEEKDHKIIQKILPKFTSLREHYYAGKWQDAIDDATDILKIHDDGPTKVLLDRSKDFFKNPPKDWTGVYTLTSK